MIEEGQLNFIRNMISKYLMEDYMPFPINKSACYEWANGLGLKKGGETILYTGCSYQLASIGQKFDQLLPKIYKIKGIENFSNLGRKFLKIYDKRATEILRNIVSLLRKAEIDFGYLYENEPYSGTVLLEMGMLKEFYEYGKKLIDLFNSFKVKKIITVDPHTHYTLLRLKEKFSWNVEVKNYLEILVNNNKNLHSVSTEEYVFHDSCLYSRFLGMRDLIRNLIKSSGINLKEDELITGKETSMCCGGPLAPINKEISDKIAKNRAEALKTVSKKVLLACPFCYVNLSPYVESYDIAEVLK
ncbi:(Fe-S)-binding protein [Acidianus sulfidivorans JP7]|uniref:(Fe-S)-binding protein n=1 Tax=Acidianus sulfidivorans JP7 TaxID=619593 RepID=A0A2U9ILQ9_9CREN|nr:(Fe-S)-binding protein [Acidianus sulfidivorans]AWR96943.1 (Fe-S)-binding protein [Acidianus sulfidivorans JP7]